MRPFTSVRSAVRGRVPAHAALLVLVAAAIVVTFLTLARDEPRSEVGRAPATPDMVGGGSSGELDALVGKDASTTGGEDLAVAPVADSDTAEHAAVTVTEAVAPTAQDGAVTTTEPIPTDRREIGVEPRIIRTGMLELSVREGRVEDRSREAAQVAARNGGYVAASSLGAREEDGEVVDGVASFTLRIPARRFDAALDSLRGLGTVRALDVSSQDITAEYTDARSRLRHLRAVEDRLIALLARTKTVGETLSVQARLDNVQERIEVDTGRLRMLDQMTTYATIELSIRERGTSSREQEERFEWGFADALRDAGEEFAETVNDAIVALGGALPTLLLLAAAALIGRRWWSRRQTTPPSAEA